MTDQTKPGVGPFKREDRYIVIKRKDLNALQQGALSHSLRDAGIEPVQGVVVESDWPEYETVWAMIEARCSGTLTQFDALTDALRAMVYETTHLSPMETDGSHWCRISAETLAKARTALQLARGDQA